MSFIGTNVEIYKNNKLFYKKYKEKFIFSLPIGEYYVKADYIKSLNKHVKPDIKLPKKEKNMNIPSFDKIKVVITNNPNKGSIDVKNNLMILDGKVIKNDLFRIFLIYHELGHYYYITEEKCDIFAIKNMVDLGYNLSQIFTAYIYFVSNNRKNFLKNKLSEISNFYNRL